MSKIEHCKYIILWYYRVASSPILKNWDGPGDEANFKGYGLGLGGMAL